MNHKPQPALFPTSASPTPHAAYRSSLVSLQGRTERQTTISTYDQFRVTLTSVVKFYFVPTWVFILEANSLRCNPAHLSLCVRMKEQVSPAASHLTSSHQASVTSIKRGQTNHSVFTKSIKSKLSCLQVCRHRNLSILCDCHWPQVRQ